MQFGGAYGRIAALGAMTVTILAGRPAAAGDLFDFSQHTWSFAVEAGPQFTPSLDVSGAHQAGALTGWGGTSATGRLEAWYTRPGGLNLGLTLQPIFNTYSGQLSNALTAKGQTFPQGAPAKFVFQFPFGLATANYPVWSDGGSEVRLGASIITRYAFEQVQSGSKKLSFANWIALPLLNATAKVQVGGAWSVVANANLLPAENGTGIFDVFAGMHYDLEPGGFGRAVEFGSRTFYGGYVPNSSTELNSRVLLQSVVLRLIF